MIFVVSIFYKSEKSQELIVDLFISEYLNLKIIISK